MWLPIMAANCGHKNVSLSTTLNILGQVLLVLSCSDSFGEEQW